MLALIGLLLQAAIGADSCATAALLPAYAHNDYRNRRPLRDALDLGYRGVEADVYRVGGDLLVGHERSEVRPAKTLVTLYLEPLRDRLHRCGYVLADRTPFLLNVELKEADSTAFSILLAELIEYQELFQPTDSSRASVRIVLVGWWPADTNTAFPDYVGRQFVIQGRGVELPAGSRTPGFVSIDYGKLLTWRGRGTVPVEDRETVAWARQLAARLGVPLRVHHAPENARVYAWLLKEGVTLLGASNLEKTRALLSSLPD